MSPVSLSRSITDFHYTVFIVFYLYSSIVHTEHCEASSPGGHELGDDGRIGNPERRREQRERSLENI